jgi:hypothetical protein
VVTFERFKYSDVTGPNATISLIWVGLEISELSGIYTYPPRALSNNSVYIIGKAVEAKTERNHKGKFYLCQYIL